MDYFGNRTPSTPVTKSINATSRLIDDEVVHCNYSNLSPNPSIPDEDLGLNLPEFEAHANDTGKSVYKYIPSNDYPKLRLLSDPMNNKNVIHLKAIIRRITIIAVVDKENDWWKVVCSGHEGWIQVLPAMLEKGVLTPVFKLRLYEDWRGNNYFFLDGRIMMGSDAKLFGFTQFLLFIPSFLFFNYVLTKSYFPVTTGVR